MSWDCTSQNPLPALPTIKSCIGEICLFPISIAFQCQIGVCVCAQLPALFPDLKAMAANSPAMAKDDNNEEGDLEALKEKALFVAHHAIRGAVDRVRQLEKQEAVAGAKYVVPNIAWMQCEDFTIGKGLLQIEEYLRVSLDIYSSSIPCVLLRPCVGGCWAQRLSKTKPPCWEHLPTSG